MLIMEGEVDCQLLVKPNPAQVTCLNETTGPCIEANPKEDIVNAILEWESSSFVARTAPEPQFERAVMPDKWLSHGGVA